MKKRLLFALTCSSALILAAGCGSSPELEDSITDSSSTVSESKTATKAAKNTGNELEQAQELCTGYLSGIDDTRFTIYSGEYETGIKFGFTDITSDSCTVSWDSYVVRDLGVGIDQNWTINGTLFGSSTCTFEPLYNNGALDSFLIDGLMMTRISNTDDGTPEADIYNFYLRFDLENSTCQLCFTKVTSGPGANEYQYKGDSMQELFDQVESAGEGEQWVEFASYVAKYGSLSELDKYEGHYYKVIDAQLTWTEASEACESVGGHLATVSTYGEQMFVQNIIRSSKQENMWIGGYYSETDEQWCWVDGSVWEYTNWDNSQPDNYTGDEFYLRMKNRYKRYANWTAMDGKWNDTADTADGYSPSSDAPISTFGYVCEWDSIRDLHG